MHLQTPGARSISITRLSFYMSAFIEPSIWNLYVCNILDIS